MTLVETAIARAKANLFLSIGELSKCGLHRIETVMCLLGDPFDTIYMSRSPRFKVTYLGYQPESPCTITLANRALRDRLGFESPVNVFVRKGIPACSGLGGSSSNAACFLLAMRKHYLKWLSNEELMEIGLMVGSDVPFFLSGHDCAFVSGHGEVVRPLSPLPHELQIRLLSSDNPASTAAQYKAWDRLKLQSSADSEGILRAIQARSAHGILQNAHNDFDLLRPRKRREGELLTGSGGYSIRLSVRTDPN